jgi:flagellar hook-length control protein FliK
MTDVVIPAQTFDSEASASASQRPVNKTNNQEFSNTLAASLEKKSQPAAKSQSPRQPAETASTSQSSLRKENNARDNGVDGQGRALPDDGNNLQAEAASSKNKTSEHTEALSRHPESDPSVQHASEHAAQALPMEGASQQPMTDMAQINTSVTSSVGSDTPDTERLSTAADPESVQATSTAGIIANQPVTPENASVSNRSAESQASVVGNPSVAAATKLSVAENNVQYGNAASSTSGRDAAQGQAKNPSLTGPGLLKFDSAAIPAFNGETPSAATSPAERILQDSPTRPLTQDMPPQQVSDQIKQWFNAGQKPSSAAQRIFDSLSEGAQASVGQQHSPARLAANPDALPPDALRNFNNHLLFEKLMSQTGTANIRSTVPAVMAEAGSTATLLAESSAQDTKLVQGDSLLQSPVSSIDGRMATPANTNMTPLLPVQTPMQHPAWSQDVGHKLMFMLNQNMQDAQLQMNPRHLGPLEVRISMGHEQQVNVTFVAHNAAARDAIDGAMPRLRDMLEQQGMNLNDFNVSQENFKQHERTAQQDEMMPQSYADLPGDELQEMEGVPGSVHTHLVSDRLVDFFA